MRKKGNAKKVENHFLGTIDLCDFPNTDVCGQICLNRDVFKSLYRRDGDIIKKLSLYVVIIKAKTV